MSMKKDEIPILILGFNRPKLVVDLLESLGSLQPKKIYFAVDGPRIDHHGDRDLVAKVQEAISVINWECEIRTLFRLRNLGLKKAVIEAIDWVFEYEEVAIILEDDCLPIGEFFSFCAETLDEYRFDSRVMQISGNSFVPISEENCHRYYFSALSDIWGWATWKRSWSLFEREIPESYSRELQNNFRQYFSNREIVKWFTRYVEEASASDSQVWSTQWTLTLVKNQGFTLVPQTNLVRNVGFKGDATHMTDEAFDIYDKFEPQEISSRTYPAEIAPNRNLDMQRFSIIKETDLNLRRNNLLINSLRKIFLRILPNTIVGLIRKFKRKNFA